MLCNLRGAFLTHQRARCRARLMLVTTALACHRCRKMPAQQEAIGRKRSGTEQIQA